MPIFHVTSQSLAPLEQTSFEEAGLRERADLQRLLRAQVGVISPDTLVLAEEFAEWDESRRRIDLLGLDRSGSLVVIELKRSDDAHMELQAIRYAAMVSAMTFERAVDVLAEHLRALQRDGDARAMILEHLGWDAPNEEEFAHGVRVVLAAGEFSKELTTSVLWLNQQGLDIRCVRLRVFRHGGDILLDVQQLIPLPEAAQYQIQVRQKEQQARVDRAERHDLRRRFWSQLLSAAAPRSALHANLSPVDDNWLWASAGISGLSWMYTVKQRECGVCLYIDFEDKALNKAAYDVLASRRPAIEQAFGGALTWQRLDDRRCSVISHILDVGGYRDDESAWPAVHSVMIDSMIRLEKALGPHLASIRPTALRAAGASPGSGAVS